MERGEPNIRPARFEDLDRLLELYRGPEGAYPNLEPPARKDAEQRFGEVLADPRQETLVAEADGAVIGTLVVAILPNLAHGGAPYAVVENVVIDETRRGQGAGTLLMRAAVEKVRLAGAYKLTLSANLSRRRAHKFYRRLGLRETHVGFEITP